MAPPLEKTSLGLSGDDLFTWSFPEDKVSLEETRR